MSIKRKYPWVDEWTNDNDAKKIKRFNKLKNPDWVENFNVADYVVSDTNTPNSFSQSIDAPKGTQSLYMDAATTRSEIFKTFGVVQDLSNKIFRVWVKCSDWDNIATDGFNFGFRDATAGVLSYFRITDLSTYEKHNDEWTPITFSFRNLRDATINMADIDRLYFRGQSISGSLEIQISYLEAIDVDTGVISIMFDDGRDSVIDGANIMAKYGFSGSNGVIRQYVGGTGYMTLDEMKKIEINYGWEHIVHGNAIYSKTDNQRIEELEEAKSWMLENNFGKSADIYVAPNGYIDETMKKTLTKYFAACRTVSRVGQKQYFYNPFNIGAVSVQNTELPADINTIIDNAMTNKEWLVLVFHQIVAGTPTSSQYNDADFETIMQHIFDSGYDVRNFSEVL